MEPSTHNWYPQYHIRHQLIQNHVVYKRCCKSFSSRMILMSSALVLSASVEENKNIINKYIFIHIKTNYGNQLGVFVVSFASSFFLLFHFHVACAQRAHTQHTQRAGGQRNYIYIWRRLINNPNRGAGMPSNIYGCTHHFHMWFRLVDLQSSAGGAFIVSMSPKWNWLNRSPKAIMLIWFWYSMNYYKIN